jgi:hypothetical protein
VTPISDTNEPGCGRISWDRPRTGQLDAIEEGGLATVRRDAGAGLSRIFHAPDPQRPAQQPGGVAAGILIARQQVRGQHRRGVRPGGHCGRPTRWGACPPRVSARGVPTLSATIGPRTIGPRTIRTCAIGVTSRSDAHAGFDRPHLCRCRRHPQHLSRGKQWKKESSLTTRRLPTPK